MKIKLLKKLRNTYILLERNGKYKAFDTEECLGGVFNQTDWVDKQSAIEQRRKWILTEAQKYKVAKKKIK